MFENMKIKLISISLFLSGMFFIQVLGKQIEYYENQKLTQVLEIESEELANQLETVLKKSINALRRQADRWNYNNGTSYELWKNDTKSYVLDNPEYQAISWVNEKNIVKWIIPLKGNEKAVGLDLNFEKTRSKTLKWVKDNNKFKITHSIDLVQGGKGFIVYFPLRLKNGGFNGYIGGVYTYEKLLSYLTKNKKLSHLARVEVYDNSQLIEQSNINELLIDDTFCFSQKIDFDHLQLTLKIYANSNWVKNHHSWLLQAFYTIAYIGILILVVLCYFLLFTRKQNKTIVESKVKLVEALNEITESEVEIRKNKNEIQTIINAISPALVIVNKNGDIIKANSAFGEYFQYEENEAIGMNVNLLIEEGLRSEHKKQMNEYYKNPIKRQMGVRMDLEALKKNGDLFPVEIGLAPVLESEEEVVVTIYDITHRIETEGILKKSLLESETARDLKEYFLNNMSHELRTPMNGILGASQLLNDMPLDKEQKELSGMIMHSTRSLLNIINDILDYSDIEANKIKLEILSFEYKKIIEDVIGTYVEEANNKGLALKIELSDDLPANLLGDQVRIRQILLNLMSNAIKFTSSGEVCIKVSCDSISKNKVSVKTEIIDTGIGLSEEQLQKIFNSFVQADLTNTRKYGGTGLGTSISKALVKIMGGYMTVNSEVNKGSCFAFTIPLPIADTKYVDKRNVDIPERNYGKTVIVAEDNMINMKVAVRSLSKLGVNVLKANNGKEALELANKEDHELILMDIQMPVMNGVDATKELIKNNYNKPIIAMTANVSKEDLRLYKDIGIISVIAKPFKNIDLIEALDPYFIL